ncbi:MAG: hypothetical protein QXI28_03485 [Candidatus Hadarchaeales archaeon]
MMVQRSLFPKKVTLKPGMDPKFVNKKLELERKSSIEKIKQGLMDLLLTGEVRVN